MVKNQIYALENKQGNYIANKLKFFFATEFDRHLYLSPNIWDNTERRSTSEAVDNTPPTTEEVQKDLEEMERQSTW